MLQKLQQTHKMYKFILLCIVCNRILNSNVPHTFKNQTWINKNIQLKKNIYKFFSFLNNIILIKLFILLFFFFFFDNNNKCKIFKIKNYYYYGSKMYFTAINVI